MSQHDVIPKQQGTKRPVAARRKLGLNPQLPEGHAALGIIAYYQDWDFVRAEQEYHRATELDPAQANTTLVGRLLCMRGRFPDSIREVDLAHTLDPAWKAPYMAAIFIFYSSGQPERALAVAQQLIQMEPDSAIAHNQMVGPTGIWAIRRLWRMAADGGYRKDADRIALEKQGARICSRARQGLCGVAPAGDGVGKTWNHASTDFVPPSGSSMLGRRIMPLRR